jgi:hypothetical protein
MRDNYTSSRRHTCAAVYARGILRVNQPSSDDHGPAAIGVTQWVDGAAWWIISSDSQAVRNPDVAATLVSTMPRSRRRFGITRRVG